jgi:DNA mismatch repair protein MutS2
MSKEIRGDRQTSKFETLIFASELGDPREVDLHGVDQLDAERQTDLFLHQSFMDGERVVRIIHGRGAGLLRETVRDVLSKHALVEYFQDSSKTEEVGGVTYAVLTQK